MPSSNNPAALQGWVKSADPKTGRTFYANHITRKTQWDPPPGWVEEDAGAFLPPPVLSDEDDSNSDTEPLPSNWEEMHDPTSGKPFYVDHERKITQWTKPRPQVKSKPTMSFAPANTTTSTTTSAAMARILQASNASAAASSYPRSYAQEASYYSSNTPHDVDFSDTLPSLDFSVKKVADKYRLECPHCDSLFTLAKRRHHCRLCGDVFCDACSAHRVTLPLPGPEFEKPVRVCDFCQADVGRGQFFSLRRYLTPLQLYNPSTPNDEDDVEGVATPANVNAALAALTLDLDQMVQADGIGTNPSEGELENKLTIPTSILLPHILKHLNDHKGTSDRAMRAITSLLTLGSILGKNEYAHAVYLYGTKSGALDNILQILERSGSDRKTLFVQELAARCMFYVTDSTVLSSLAQTRDELMTNNASGDNDNDDNDDLGTVESLDSLRCLRNMLDHSSNAQNPNLQRWSAATVRNLVVEDQRRACFAVNEVAARVASGEPPSQLKLEYESFLDSLVASGGIMILCSLVAADDSDTRAHATGALGAILMATRAIDDSMAALSEMTGGAAGRTNKKDGDIVRAISAGGGCGSSVSQLLLSADHAVASMGCDFLASLVLPLLTDPQGCATLSRGYDCRNDSEGLGACREAALEICSNSCLPALLSLVRESGPMTRPIELRKTAMETLAATINAVGEMGKAWADGKYEEGLERSGAPATITRAITMLNEEQVIDTALEILKSSSVQSLGSNRDTPASRIREGAGIILGALTSCSAEAIMELHSRQCLSTLIMAANDASMTAPSTLRGDTAPRCLGMLEAASSILMFTWQHPSGASSELLDRLIEALDVGAITYLFRVSTAKMDWDSRDKSAGGMKARSAACRLCCCLFGIALTDETAIGMRRLMEACDSDQAHRANVGSGNKGPRNIMEAILTVLQYALNHAHKMLVGGTSRGPHYQAALLDLVESAILAVGSMCGSSVAPGGGEGTMIKGDQFLAMRADEFESRRREVCKVACDVVIRGGRNGPALLPTMLVGGFGEGAVVASLRLALAIAQNGSKEQHSKLALSGILVPISDLLRTALSRGDLYKFSAALALVRFCGPHVAAGTSGGVQSVRDAIKVATNVLTLPINPDASVQQIETQESLKSECISALESLSKNAALWSSISTDALPSIVSYLHSTCEPGSGGLAKAETRCAALRAVLEIVQVPSHAVSAADAGLAEPLGRMLSSINAMKARHQEVDDDMQMLALEVLHVLALNADARRHCRLLQGDVLRAVCTAVGYSTADQPKKPSDSRADITFLGLEILHSVLDDVEGVGDTPLVLQSPEAIAYLDVVASEPKFVRSLCATLLFKTGMKIEQHDSENGDSDDTPYDVPRLYGPPLILVQDKCAGEKDTHEAACALLFTVSVYACAIESRRSETYWNAALLQDMAKTKDATECMRTGSTFSAHFLKLLADDYPPFVPTDNHKKQDYSSLTRPLVRYRLLEALKDSMGELTTDSVLGHREMDPYMLSILVKFNLPHICLSVWKDPALLDLAFEVIKQMVEADPDEVLHLFVESKEAIMSLFDLLNLDASTEALVKVGDIRRFLASTLEKLAQNGMLTQAVERFDVRSSAISALAAACLTEEEQHPDDDEELTSNRLSSGLMQTLVELCTVENGGNYEGKHKTIRLSSAEAESIARNLGKKICHMVISRFLERAKLQAYEIEDDEDVMAAPDVAMLCAIAQHEKALQILRSIGGLHALAQVASEGELSAVLALQQGCKGEPSLLLEADTYISVMSLFSEEKEHGHWRSDAQTRGKLESAAFELLAQLCIGSAKGQKAVASADVCNDCFERALEVLAGLVSMSPPPPSFDGVVSLPPPSAPSREGTDDEQDTDDGQDIGDEEEKAPDLADEDNISEQDSGTVAQYPVVFLNEVDDPTLVIAAYSFLSSLAQVPKIRTELLKHDTFVVASSALVKETKFPELQFEAVRVIAKLAPYATTRDTLSSERVGALLQSVLSQEPEFKDGSPERFTRNGLHGNATGGIQFIYDSLPEGMQASILAKVTERYAKLLKSHTVTRAVSKGNDRTGGGELAYHLTTLMLLAKGKACVEECFNYQVVASFVNTIQWRYDPKSTISDGEVAYWDASVTHCLQLLALVLWRDNESLAKAGIKIQDLKRIVLMVARPGKAPRKAIDFPSALGVVAKNGEATAKIAAIRIIECMSSEM